MTVKIFQTYFIGDLANLVTDLSGDLKESQDTWDALIALLKDKEILDDKGNLNKGVSPEALKKGLEQAAVFTENNLNISGLQLCCLNSRGNAGKVEITKNGTSDVNTVKTGVFECPNIFVYLLPESDDELVNDCISDDTAQITASASVLLKEENSTVTVTDLETGAEFLIS